MWIRIRLNGALVSVIPMVAIVLRAKHGIVISGFENIKSNDRAVGF